MKPIWSALLLTTLFLDLIAFGPSDAATNNFPEFSLSPIELSVKNGGKKETNEPCQSCHSKQFEQWAQSDHAHAMSLPDKDLTLPLSLDRDSAHLQRNQNQIVKYAFGYAPLQQYIVDIGNGHWQVWPFSWDARDALHGGQRWFDSNAKATSKGKAENTVELTNETHQRLHWRQPLQNYNGMCADCHSSGLQRQYDVDTNTFNTTFEHINVNCTSCHNGQHKTDIMTKHDVDTEKKESIKAEEKNYDFQPSVWLRAKSQNTAQLVTTVEHQKSRRLQMQTCFGCHSLRVPLTDGIEPQREYLDQFSPKLIETPLYHPDGTTNEEVFVYGAFLQSKMYRHGVTCLDCHDKHTMKLKDEGNALCAQCHNPQEFDQTSHHGHTKNTTASECVTCHMPENTFMGVDKRREHSFRVPKTDNFIRYGLTNVCQKCHQEELIVAKNNKRPRDTSLDNKGINEHNFITLQQGKSISITSHLAIINDTSLPEIIRASAIALLPRTTKKLTNKSITRWINSENPLIRLATARIGNLLSSNDRALDFTTLLTDRFKAVRVAAVSHYSFTDMSLASKELKQQITQALNERIAVNTLNAWRGEGRLNLSQSYLQRNDTEQAIKHLKQSINIDPFYPNAYILLANIYKQAVNKEENLGAINKIGNEEQVYKLALNNLPSNALIHYSYALYLTRQASRTLALKHFKTAYNLENNSLHTYTYLLALEQSNKLSQALELLLSLNEFLTTEQRYSLLGIRLSQKLNNKKHYQYFKQKARQLNYTLTN